VREYSEYVESKFIEWNNKYDIPEYFEFQLKTMFELEEQFREQPKENVKTKQDILRMIQDLHGRLQFRIKENKEIKDKVYSIKLINNENNEEIIDIINHNIKYLKSVYLGKGKDIIKETNVSLLDFVF
jgi:hypothetical protein